jgi:hypothetical protein
MNKGEKNEDMTTMEGQNAEIRSASEREPEDADGI